MGGKLLGACNAGCLWAELARGSFVQGDDAGDLDKIQDVERRSEAGCASGGHDMAGSGDVIPQHLAGALAQEQPPCIANLGRQGSRVGDRQAEMLWRILACQAGSRFEVRREDDAAA